MGTFFKVIGILIAIAAATFLCVGAAMFGASLGGLQGGSPTGWEFFPALFGGPFFGFIISVAIAIFVSASIPSYPRRLATTLLVPPVIVFIGFTVVYANNTHSQRQEERAYQSILSSIKNDPAALHALIVKTQTRPISWPEKQALYKIVESPVSIPTEDIPALILGFEKNSMNREHVFKRITTQEQMRAIYESNKNLPQYEVLSSLIDHPLMPPDILQEMTLIPDIRLVTDVQKHIAEEKKKTDEARK